MLSGNTLAVESDGIKTKNLEGADLDLMNDHDPQTELENFELLDGYQINLFASEPMLANPVHMHWDTRGRLWVACSWAYPQLKPGDVANDKIIILEDTDGDGAADKSTVFADGLYLPTGIEFANGGVYVGQSPDVFFLKDTDGDDVADVKELALTGFGIEDNHHSISAWRRGPGGWIYFQEGIFLHAQVETPFGVVRNYNGGVYQFNPRTQELRVLLKSARADRLPVARCYLTASGVDDAELPVSLVVLPLAYIELGRIEVMTEHTQEQLRSLVVFVVATAAVGNPFAVH